MKIGFTDFASVMKESIHTGVTIICLVHPFCSFFKLLYSTTSSFKKWVFIFNEIHI